MQQLAGAPDAYPLAVIGGGHAGSLAEAPQEGALLEPRALCQLGQCNLFGSSLLQPLLNGEDGAVTVVQSWREGAVIALLNLRSYFDCGSRFMEQDCLV